MPGPEDPETQRAAPPRSNPNATARALAALPRTFAALQIPGYRWYWLGTASAFMGMQMQWPAQAWLAYELTGSAFKLGLVSAAWGAPMLLLSLLGGVLADRMQKRDLLIMSQLGLGVINLAVAVLISVGLIEYWHLLVAATLSGTVFAFNMPARQAIIPELVPRRTLFNAIVLSSGVMNASRVVGPALCGVLIAGAGTQGAFYTAVGCILIAVPFLAKIPLTAPAGRRGRVSMATEIGQGLRYVRGNPLILTLLGMVLVVVLFGMPFQSLMPVFAEILEVEALGYGFLMAMVGIGAVAGSLVIANLSDFRRKGLLTLCLGISFGLTLVLFANVGSLYPSLIVLTVVGASSTGFMSTNNTLIQMNITDEVRGRVMSVYMMTFALMPLGTLPAGAIAETLGAPFAVTLGGSILAAFVLLLAVLRPQLRRLE